MANERLTSLDMNLRGMVMAMGGGNPGALSVCMYLLKFGEQVDPDSALGGLGSLMQLDSLNVWEHRIWMLFRYVCGEDIGKMIAVLRANQLGLLSDEKINYAIDNYGKGVDLDAVVSAVKKQLPKFNTAAAARN